MGRLKGTGAHLTPSAHPSHTSLEKHKLCISYFLLVFGRERHYLPVLTASLGLAVPSFGFVNLAGTLVLGRSPSLRRSS